MKFVFYAHFWLLLFDGVQGEDSKIEEKKKFCGGKLGDTLRNFCVKYNEPVGFHRGRRYITKECCDQPCTLQYMLKYYCKQINSDALKNYQKELQQQAIHRKPIRTAKLNKNSEDVAEDPTSPRKSSNINDITRDLTSAQTTDDQLEKLSQKSLLISALKNPKPAAQIGEIQDSSKPFYLTRSGSTNINHSIKWYQFQKRI